MIAIEDKIPRSLYRSDPNSFLGKMWAVFTKEVQGLEVVFADLEELLDIYQRGGNVLDLIGELVREFRQGRTDEEFRLALFVALMKQLSSGSLKDIIDVGRAIIQSGEFYVTKELCYEAGSTYLDAKRLLDGRQPLSGSAKRPASFEMLFSGPVDQIEVPLELGRAVDQVRAGGVHGKVRVRFVMQMSEMVLQTAHSSILDASGILDGKTFLSPELLTNATEIALGDGAHASGSLRIPLPSDTGLQNEILRRPVEPYQANGVNGFLVTVYESELNDKKVDELLLDGPNGTIGIHSFGGKKKDGTILYEFAILEDAA